MKKQVNTEPQFAVQLLLNASLLGPLMAFLDNKATAIDVKLVKNIKAGGNSPPGALYAATVEILQKAGGKKERFSVRDELVKNGFPILSVQTQLLRYVLDKKIIRQGDNLVLPKGKAT